MKNPLYERMEKCTKKRVAVKITQDVQSPSLHLIEPKDGMAYVHHIQEQKIDLVSSQIQPRENDKRNFHPLVDGQILHESNQKFFPWIVWRRVLLSLVHHAYTERASRRQKRPILPCSSCEKFYLHLPHLVLPWSPRIAKNLLQMMQELHANSLDRNERVCDRIFEEKENDKND